MAFSDKTNSEINLNWKKGLLKPSLLCTHRYVQTVTELTHTLMLYAGPKSLSVRTEGKSNLCVTMSTRCQENGFIQLSEL
jgi:hypothetical protein